MPRAHAMALAFILSLPLWFVIGAGSLWLLDAARHGRLPVLSLRGSEPFGGER